MSGSSKKKLRKEQKIAALTEKQLQAKKEAKQLKAYTLTFVVAMALVVAIILGMVLQSPIESLINSNTHAVTIGNHELTVPEFSYFFVNEIDDYVRSLYNQYGNYASYFMGFSGGVSLNKQVYDKTTGETWAQYFMKRAARSAQEVYGVYDLAIAAGHTMTEEETAALNSAMTGIDEAAKKNGYSSTNAYLAQLYGNGANRKTYEKFCSISSMASSYYNAHTEEVRAAYTDSDLRKFEEDKIGEYYSYTYLSHEIKVEDYLGTGTKDENGKVTYTDEQKAAALEAAKADVEKILGSTITDAESFNKVLEEMFKAAEAENDKTEEDSSSTSKPSGDAKTTTSTENTESTNGTESTGSTESTGATEGSDKKEEEKKAPTCTEADRYLYYKLPETLQDWVKSEDLVLDKLTSLEVTKELPHTHEEGEEHSDDEEVETEVTGFIIVLMQKVDKNDMKMVNVRHILIELEELAKDATEDQKKEADAAAKANAEDILNQWKMGDKTPESFGELANKNSKDPGSNTNGGLYEDIYPGWAVEEFDAWCFDAERKVGDTGIVKSDNGYHVMYLDGFTDYSFRDYMITNDLLSEDITEWVDSVVAATPYTEVDLSRMNWDITYG